MQSPSEQIVVGIGEVLWDCFDDRRRPGGAPANVAFHAGQLGHRGVIGSRVGKDGLGDELIEYLRSRGLDTTFIQIDDSRPTGRVTVDTSDPAHPTFTIHEDVAWDRLSIDAGLENLIREAAAICVGTLAQRSPTGRETVRRCLEVAGESTLVVFDVNLRQHWFDREVIESTLGKARIVKLNLDEVSILGELLHGRAVDPRAFSTRLIEGHGVELVCVTRAEDGCLLVSGDEGYDLPGRSVDVVDAVGAGDAFTAALISARLRGWQLGRAGRFANEVGAMLASRDGAMPILGEALDALISRAESGQLDS